MVDIRPFFLAPAISTVVHLPTIPGFYVLSLGCETRLRAVFSGTLVSRFCASSFLLSEQNINNNDPRNSSVMRRFHTRGHESSQLFGLLHAARAPQYFSLFFFFEFLISIAYCTIFLFLPVVDLLCVVHDKRKNITNS